MNRCVRCPIPAELICHGIDVRRFCELLNPNEPAYDPGYAEVLWRLATPLSREPPGLELAESLGLLRAMKACLFHSRDPESSCGCGRCGLRGGAEVNHGECFACIQRYTSDV